VILFALADFVVVLLLLNENFFVAVFHWTNYLKLTAVVVKMLDKLSYRHRLSLATLIGAGFYHSILIVFVHDSTKIDPINITCSASRARKFVLHLLEF
jgi:hypothetical protein